MSVREFKMPDVGEGLTEAEILKWFVQPGDTVTDGQVVCEVETAKAAVELPIPFDGVVRELIFPEGTTVDVGTVIITVATEGAAESEPAPADGPAGEEPEPERREVLVGYGPRSGASRRRARKPGPAAPASGGSGTAPGTAAQSPAGGFAAPGGAPALGGSGGPAGPAPGAPASGGQGTAVPGPAGGPASDFGGPAAPGGAAGQGAGGVGATLLPQSSTAFGSGGFAAGVSGGVKPLAKPPVRKLAKDLGVDLAAVTPTGPGGTITRDDVHAYVNGLTVVQEPEQAAGSTPVAAASVASAPEDLRVPIKGVRKATAAAMVASAFTAPHVTEWVQVDVTRTMKLVRKLKESGELGAGVRVSPLLIVAKALLTAIRRNPEINASWDEANQEIVVKRAVNLGIAAATPRGLIVPNIKDAGAKSLADLAIAFGELIDTARQGKTSPAAMQGGTVTITNVGVFGVDAGTPILNPGEAAILAVGQIRELPWVHKGRVVPRQVTTLALSFDHRMVDGELGSKVLADTAAVLEQPKRLITWG